MDSTTRSVPQHPLEIDGSVDQLREVAELAIQQDAERRRIAHALDLTKGVLRALMGAARTRVVRAGRGTIRLKSLTDVRCVEHRAPADACYRDHKGKPLSVARMNVAAEYFEFKHDGDCDGRQEPDQ